MATLADIFGVGSVLKMPDGKEYTLRPPTLYEQGEYQRWLEQRAHDAVDRSRVADEAKDRRHHLIDIDAGLGKYEWDGEFAVSSIWTPAGMAKIVEIICRDQDVDSSRAEEIVRTNIREVAAKILLQAVEDPKALAPVLAALGFPTGWLDAESNTSSSSNCSTHPSTEPSPNLADLPTTSSSSSTTASAAPMG